MRRREFLAAAIGCTVASGAAEYRFKLGLYLPELDLPFDQALDTANEIGAKYVWFNQLKGETPVSAMTDAEADRMAERVARRGLEICVLNAGNPFKEIHLADLELKTLADHPLFGAQFHDLTRSMQIARRLGIRAVGAFTFAWPGEYSAGKPTWPMRWMTRGGVMSAAEVEKWLKAFGLVAEQAERLGVDVALSMMPWNYTNTTGNFRRLVEKLGSRRMKVMWGPADNWNSGEWDVATAGFENVRPYLCGLHLKDLHVIDGLNLKFEYRPLGEGDVDYVTILRKVREHRLDVVLSVSTHFLPPSGSREEAMRINFENLRGLIRKAEAASIR
ncbi:MAG: sugar phosphate isomerase/epimerase [Acidobacteria bacterium]|nr:sugar phosphate isomerase/epimerase [Acidobacteriota bacterium]